MIITLTKADFSSCKIGTLTTFNVRKSTVIGASVNIIKTSVERAGYSSATTIATIVLDKANYEGHAIKVMMGSTDVSSWYSVGNVIVPANTPITSNITISVSATAIVPDVPDTPGEVVNPDGISWIINGYQGDGSINSLTTRARVFVKVEDAQNATIVGNSNVKYCLYAFGNNIQTSYLGKIDGFINGEINSNIIEELGKKINDTSSIKYIGVTAGYKDDSEITDINGFGNNFTFTGVSNATIRPENPFVVGGISSSNGELISNSNRSRTYPFEIKNVTVTNNPGYQHIIYLYSGVAADQTCFVSKLNDWALETEISLDSIPQTTTHYRIIVKNDAGTAITPLDAYQNTIIK